MARSPGGFRDSTLVGISGRDTEVGTDGAGQGGDPGQPPGWGPGTGLGSWQTRFWTSLGPGTLVWGCRGLQAVVLPGSGSWGAAGEASARRAQDQRVASSTVEDQPAWVQEVGEMVAATLDGGWPRVPAVPLDWSVVTPFVRRVLEEILQGLPPGSTWTYGELAARLGQPGGARAVGRALAANPWPVLVPCHRVVRTDGALGGYSGPGGLATKGRLLALEAAGAARFDGSGWASVLARAARELQGADPELARVIEAVGPCRLRPEPQGPTWWTLARVVVAQQLAGPAVQAVRARLERLVGTDEGAAGRYLAASPEQRRGVGLSAAKAETLWTLAEAARSGSLPTLEELGALADRRVVDLLSGFRGVGRWSAEMLLVFGLGRLDVLAVDDYGLRRGLGVLRGGPQGPPVSRSELAEAGERWRPYRSVASWYLWRLAERPGLLEGPGSGTGSPRPMPQG